MQPAVAAIVRWPYPVRRVLACVLCLLLLSLLAPLAYRPGDDLFFAWVFRGNVPMPPHFDEGMFFFGLGWLLRGLYHLADWPWYLCFHLGALLALVVSTDEWLRRRAPRLPGWGRGLLLLAGYGWLPLHLNFTYYAILLPPLAADVWLAGSRAARWRQPYWLALAFVGWLVRPLAGLLGLGMWVTWHLLWTSGWTARAKVVLVAVPLLFVLYALPLWRTPPLNATARQWIEMSDFSTCYQRDLSPPTRQALLAARIPVLGDSVFRANLAASRAATECADLPTRLRSRWNATFFLASLFPFGTASDVHLRPFYVLFPPLLLWLLLRPWAAAAGSFGRAAVWLAFAGSVFVGILVAFKYEPRVLFPVLYLGLLGGFGLACGQAAQPWQRAGTAICTLLLLALLTVWIGRGAARTSVLQARSAWLRTALGQPGTTVVGLQFWADGLYHTRVLDEMAPHRRHHLLPTAGWFTGHTAYQEMMRSQGTTRFPDWLDAAGRRGARWMLAPADSTFFQSHLCRVHGRRIRFRAGTAYTPHLESGPMRFHAGHFRLQPADTCRIAP